MLTPTCPITPVTLLYVNPPKPLTFETLIAFLMVVLPTLAVALTMIFEGVLLTLTIELLTLTFTNC